MLTFPVFNDFFSLAKPGIVFGNLIATAAGFFLASQGHVDWLLLAQVLLGTALVIASGCALNNCADRDIDAKMQRTRNRVLVTGKLSTSQALQFAIITGVLGFGLLIYTPNWLLPTLGAFGFVVYVGFYTLISKRTSVHSTEIGSLSGACPPVMGYVAVTANMDTGAWLLLLIFCLWQIPHSYAIAIYRLDDYAAAKIPVLPIKQGIDSARRHMLVCTVAFTICCLLLSYINYTGWVFAVAMLILGTYWSYVIVSGYQQSKQLWGRRLFVLSVISICCFSVLISLDFVTGP